MEKVRINFNDLSYGLAISVGYISILHTDTDKVSDADMANITDVAGCLCNNLVGEGYEEKIPDYIVSSEAGNYAVSYIGKYISGYKHPEDYFSWSYQNTSKCITAHYLAILEILSSGFYNEEDVVKTKGILSLLTQMVKSDNEYLCTYIDFALIFILQEVLRPTYESKQLTFGIDVASTFRVTKYIEGYNLFFDNDPITFEAK